MYFLILLEHLTSVSNMPLNSVNHKTLFWFQFAIVTWPKIEVLSTYYPIVGYRNGAYQCVLYALPTTT